MAIKPDVIIVSSVRVLLSKLEANIQVVRRPGHSSPKVSVPSIFSILLMSVRDRE
jgi:hypothetical protein